MASHKYQKLTNRPNWKWFKALYLYDLDDVVRIVSLIESEPIPPLLRKDISRIISGERKPNKNASSKLKIRAVDRLNLLQQIYDFEEEYAFKFRLKRRELDENRNLQLKNNENFFSSNFEYYERLKDKEIKSNFKVKCLEFGVNPRAIRAAYKKFKEQIKSFPSL